jgi:hypothetical protein
VWVVPVVFGRSLECLLCVGLPPHDLVTQLYICSS